MGKICPYCGRMLPDEARFCSACGANIEQISAPNAMIQPIYPQTVCMNCGAVLRAEARFCKKCGVQIRQNQGIVQPQVQSSLPLPPQGDVFSSYNASHAKRSPNYTGLRIVLLIICFSLFVVGITTIPDNIREQTGEQNTGITQTETLEKVNSDVDENDDENNSIENNDEEVFYDRETAEMLDEYEEIEKKFEAGGYSGSEEDEQLRKDMTWAHDQMNNWMYGYDEESEETE